MHDMNIHEVQEAISAFITMVYERNTISEDELAEVEKAESALIHYIAEKEKGEWIMVTRLNAEMWRELEATLIKYGAGYKVEIDNHLGKPELNIHLDTIKVFMPEVEAR